jgi:hypothetical protein
LWVGEAGQDAGHKRDSATLTGTRSGTAKRAKFSYMDQCTISAEPLAALAALCAPVRSLRAQSRSDCSFGEIKTGAFGRWSSLRRAIEAANVDA